jgi:hypothetical protein
MTPAGAAQNQPASERLSPVPDLLYSQIPALQRGEGLVVVEAPPGSALRGAGLQQHDILLRADQTPVREAQELQKLLAAARKDRPAHLTILRAGKLRTLTVPQLDADATEVAKAWIKQGGPPQVTVEAEKLQNGNLKVVFSYAGTSGKLEQVTCSGSLPEIETQVQKLSTANTLPAPVQDMMDVALRRIRVAYTEKR